MTAKRPPATSAATERRALDDEEDVYTLDEVAKHFRVSRSAVHDWVTNDEIGHFYAGRFLRFTLAHIKAYKAKGGAKARRAAARAAAREAGSSDATPARPVNRRKAVA